ncbi:hypothetical protein H0N96_01585 [Candidatus Micrarchaeota archaeon]|nr:hypothetical protein [Candidatus Micrarchaeota archaeon]
MIPKNIDCKAVIVTALICEGSVYMSNYKGYKRAHIKFANASKKLNRIFAYCMSQAYDLAPTLYNYAQENIFHTEYSTKQALDVVEDLHELTPTFRTSPRLETITEYLSSPQPTIQYVLNQDFNTRNYCLRFAMSCEGAITFSRKDNGCLRAALVFGCGNPKLVSEWQALFSHAGISMNLKRDNDIWSGINGLRTTKIEDLHRFALLGGFIEDTKVVRGKYFQGIDKNALLNSALDFNKQRPQGYNKWTTPKVMKYLCRDCRGR